jgi:VWFA-related protein
MALKRIAAATLLFLITAECASLAQDGTPKTHSLSLDVDLVLVNASVTDSLRNRPMSGLNKNNFQVWEDKVEQKITHFSSEDVPVSVGIIFDVSGSMNGITALEQRAAATFFKSGTKDDEYFEVMFSNRPKLVSDFTTDINRLQQSLLSTQAKGSTALYDAVYLGLNKLKESNNPKKALLLITDGEDNSSRYSFSDVRDFVREQNIQIYGIDVTGSSRGVSRTLTQMSELTGGQTFYPGAGQDMPDICRKIAAELKNQYVIGYRSTNSAKDGAWRRIKVAVNVAKGPYGTALNVRAKQGYYAPAGDEVVDKKK